MTKIPDETELALKLIGSYPKMDLTEPASWITFTDNSVADERLLEVCHADLDCGPSATGLMTAVPIKTPLAISYLNWLISGPFRQWQEHIQLKSLEDAYYILIPDLSKLPSNVMFNFCVATRLPLEFPMILKYWGLLVKAGVDPGLAFMCSQCVYTTKRGTYDFPYQLKIEPLDWKLTDHPSGSGHMWTNPTSNWHRIIEGNPSAERFLPPYTEDTSCLPCNVIWGEGGRSIMTSFVGKTVREMISLFEAERKLKPITPSSEPVITLPPVDLDEDYDGDEFDFLEYDEEFDEDE